MAEAPAWPSESHKFYAHANLTQFANWLTAGITRVVVGPLMKCQN